MSDTTNTEQSEHVEIVQGDAQTSQSQSIKRKTRETSTVWNYFEKIPLTGDNKQRAKCKQCNATYIVESSYGTKNMKRHLDVCVKSVRQDVRQMLLSKTLTTGDMSIRGYEFNEELFRETMAMTIVSHDYPFQIVEHEGLRLACSILNPQFKPITRNTAKADVLKLYKREKKGIKELLQSVPSRFSITTDLWTSITTDGYLCLTCHFIDKEWKLHKKILNFKQMPPPHSGPELTTFISRLLNDEWGIENKLFSITVDNAMSNDNFVSLYKTQLNIKKVLICKGEYLHVRCCAHILNLIVQDGLKEMDASVYKIRESVKYIKGSQVRKKRFMECVQQLGLESRKGLCQDVPTRWNSTYLMIESVLTYRVAFEQLSLRDNDYKNCLTIEEWEKAEIIHKFLKVFYDATNTFSGTLYPTSNLYFHGVWKIKARLKDEANSPLSYVRAMVVRMQAKFDKYWSDFSMLFAIAVILDPRYKMKVVEYAYNKIFEINAYTHVMGVRDRLYALFDEYMVRFSSNDERLAPSTIATSRNGECEEDDEMEGFDTFLSSSSLAQETKSQLDLYLEEPNMDRKNQLDILAWWRVNEFRFPNLAQLARDILAIPVSTVASEAAFSVGGRVLDQFRSTLQPDVIEALICTRDWVLGSKGKEKMEEVGVDVENLNVEFSSSLSHRDSNDVDS